MNRRRFFALPLLALVPPVDAIPLQYGSYRVYGRCVSIAKPYIIGDRGPELFLPLCEMTSPVSRWRFRDFEDFR